MVLLAVRKMPALVQLSEIIPARSWRVRERLFPFMKTSLAGFKQNIPQAKQVKKVGFVKDDADKARQVDEDSDYWTTIRQG